MILFASILSNKSLMEEATKCLFRTSLRSQFVAHKLSWFSTDHVGVLLPKIKKFPKIPTDGWLSQHQLGFLSTYPNVVLYCQCPLTVKHILVECVDLKDVRNKHFVASSIKDLFDSIEVHKIIDFIKETRFISNFNVFILMFVICFLF